MNPRRFPMDPDKLARVLALVAEEADPLGPTAAEHTRFLLEYYFPGEQHQRWLDTETPEAIAAVLRAIGGEEGLKEDRRWLIKERNRLQEELAETEQRLADAVRQLRAIKSEERRVFRGFQEVTVSQPASPCASCGRELWLNEVAHRILGPDRIGAVLCAECRRDPGQWFARDEKGPLYQTAVEE